MKAFPEILDELREVRQVTYSKYLKPKDLNVLTPCYYCGHVFKDHDFPNVYDIRLKQVACTFGSGPVCNNCFKFIRSHFKREVKKI